MRFWSSFHLFSLDIISRTPGKLTLRAPDAVRVRMTAAHLAFDGKPGACFTHYDHDTRLWECRHSPCMTGQHCLYLWVSDSDRDDQWTTAVRFDVNVRQATDSISFPHGTDTFNQLRCQLITPIDGCLSRDALPADIIVRVPGVRDVQLQIDENTVVEAKHLPNDLYKLKVPADIPDTATDLVVMGLCSDEMYFTALLTYKIE